MGYLLLDTRQAGQARVLWGVDGVFTAWQTEGRASDILAVVHAQRAVLQEQLEGVLIASGPGRFSALRVGVLYAHVIARWFRVPLYEATADDMANEATYVALLQAVEVGERTPAVYVAPKYDREPNITLPRV